MNRRATIVRELQPLDDRRIHGVTTDGALVWFALDGELVAFDPEHERVVRRFVIPGANAGTAFDGEHIYQVAHSKILVIDPVDGRVVRTMEAPAGEQSSGLAYAEGHFFLGAFRDPKILEIDAETGEIVKTLKSDRLVTGVSCVDGALWHGTAYDGPCELRRLAPDGTVEETLMVDVPEINGLEGNRDGTFWCGGENGKLRLVRAS